MRKSEMISKGFVAVFPVLFLLMSAHGAGAASRIPNDPYFDEQWYLRHIGVPEAWNTSLGFEGVSVAVIDSGVDIDHPDLKDNIWRNFGEVAGDGIDNDGNGYVDDVFGWDFVDDDADPNPSFDGPHSTLGANHGTISAGIIAARGDNHEGIVGVTWQTKVMAIRALDSNGVGDPLDIVRAIEYAVRNGAQVINLSFAGDTENDLLRIALRNAYDAGVFVVAAAGNAPEGGEATDLDKDPKFPVCLDQGADENFIYGVTATDALDKKASFSNYGAGCVDISAPGTRVISTQSFAPDTEEFSELYGGYYNGTSIAAPVVSGVVALIKALDRNLTPKQIQNIFTATAFNIQTINPDFVGRLGRGRIEAGKAVQSVVAEKPQIAPPISTISILPPETRKIVIAAAGAGRAPEVRMFTQDGLFVRGFEVYPTSFRGGVSVDIADFDGSGTHTIITGAGAGGSPQVRIFNMNTQPIGGFFAYDQAFTGGVDIAVGDLDGDGKDEIITGAGKGGGPHVRVFTPQGVPIGGFFAFEEWRRDGVDIAVGDLDGDGKDEIIATNGTGTTTRVRVFSPRGELLAEFTPFASLHVAGANIAVADVTGDRLPEIIVRSLVDEGTSLFSAAGDRLFGIPGKDEESLPDSIVYMGSASGALPLVTVLGPSPRSFYAFEPGFRGGVDVGIMEIR